MLMIFSGNSCRHGQRNVAEARHSVGAVNPYQIERKPDRNRQTKLTKRATFYSKYKKRTIRAAAPGTAAIFIAESEGTTHEHTPSRFYRNPAGPAARARRHPTRDGTHADWRALVWLERDEENKTFGIAFPTLPKDDTGVFHILEHSVLCGRTATRSRSPSSNCSNTR